MHVRHDGRSQLLDDPRGVQGLTRFQYDQVDQCGGLESIQDTTRAFGSAADVREGLGDGATARDAGDQAISQFTGKRLGPGAEAADVDRYGTAQIVVALARPLEPDCVRLAVFGVLDLFAMQQPPNQPNVLGKRLYPHGRSPKGPHRRIFPCRYRRTPAPARAD